MSWIRFTTLPAYDAS